jgi:transposase
MNAGKSPGTYPEAGGILHSPSRRIEGVKENCRNAQVVFDKFHVLANASKRVDQERHAEVRGGGADVRDSLRKSQWLWLKNPENLNKKEQARLAKIEEKNLCTGKAY